MGGVVNTLKQTTNVERPDGSNRHSFPLGHTATAFIYLGLNVPLSGYDIDEQAEFRTSSGSSAGVEELISLILTWGWWTSGGFQHFNYR